MQLVIEVNEEDYKRYKEDKICSYTSAVLDAVPLNEVLDKIRAEIEMYEADCRLQGGTDECEKCNSNVFGSVYRIIDKYREVKE